MDISNCELVWALSDFHEDHPFQAALIAVYGFGVLICFTVLCGSLHDLRTVPWLPTIFLTDGILVWFCPFAAVLPILLWPLLPIGYFLLACFQLLHDSFRFSLTAPTFCGIKREAFVRLYRACAERLQRWKLDWRDRKQRRARLLVRKGGLRDAPLMDHDAANANGIEIDREPDSSPSTSGCSTPSSSHLSQAPPQSYAASVTSVPPPYQE